MEQMNRTMLYLGRRSETIGSIREMQYLPSAASHSRSRSHVPPYRFGPCCSIVRLIRSSIRTVTSVSEPDSLTRISSALVSLRRQNAAKQLLLTQPGQPAAEAGQMIPSVTISSNAGA